MLLVVISLNLWRISVILDYEKGSSRHIFA